MLLLIHTLYFITSGHVQDFKIFKNSFTPDEVSRNGVKNEKGEDYNNFQVVISTLGTTSYRTTGKGLEEIQLRLLKLENVGRRESRKRETRQLVLDVGFVVL